MSVPAPSLGIAGSFSGRTRPLPIVGTDRNIGSMRKAGGMGAGMQRVRIGLTGLAFVFLAVLLAMVFTRQPTGEEPITANLLDQQSAGQPLPEVPDEEEPAEPLAELGVAPGKAETNAADAPADAQGAPSGN